MTATPYERKLKRTGNNMDAIRYVLAFAVVVEHFNYLCGAHIPFPISGNDGVGGFFALSGFLIYRNFEKRPALRDYIAARARRILPPYLFIVLLCAFLLAAVSSLPVAGYFTDPQWWRYLVANALFLNFIEPSLPGVFEGAQFTTAAVNGSLWTMKVEWCLYLSVPLVAALLRRLHRTPRDAAWIFCVIIAVSAGYTWLFSHLHRTTGHEIYAILGRQVFGQLSFFYTGVLLFYRLDTLLRHKWIILLLLMCGLAAIRIWPETGVFLRPPVHGTLVIWFSMVGNWGHRISRHDNVSYDIYLFHFPLMQLAVMAGITRLGQWTGLLAVTAAVTMMAFLSWNLVGRRFMRPRPRRVAPATT
ncbi:MAG: acyltransferase [Muribaculaceae bacterium]|nr:acyltransferase [Muribaculaceae bacterium]